MSRRPCTQSLAPSLSAVCHGPDTLPLLRNSPLWKPHGISAVVRKFQFLHDGAKLERVESDGKRLFPTKALSFVIVSSRKHWADSNSPDLEILSNTKRAEVRQIERSNKAYIIREELFSQLYFYTHCSCCCFLWQGTSSSSMKSSACMSGADKGIWV